ncbi:MAG: pyridoxal-phosphate dependent enzyme [Enterobacterales bacterium]|nr:pyridoxal-phosphate dependent enzyme [Enterobacterales bacterium]
MTDLHKNNPLRIHTADTVGEPLVWKPSQSKIASHLDSKPTSRTLTETLNIRLPSPIQTIRNSIIQKAGVTLDIKRDDLIHPIISGNKWRKLQGLVSQIINQNTIKIATMGGRYSNYLHALAYASHQFNWQCDFYVRGYPQQVLTPTLKDITQWGCQIHFVDRQTFKAMRHKPPRLDEPALWLPEGGLNPISLQGFAQIFNELETVYDTIIIASATGTSVAGLVKGCNDAGLKTKIIGISVLNNHSEQLQNITDLLSNPSPNWKLLAGYEFGGFAKSKPELSQFIEQFEQEFGLPLESLYSGKSFYATLDLISKGYFPTQSRILLIHCGGLQGKRKP